MLMAEGDPIRIIPHRGVDCGSLEVWFADGRKPVRFYWDNLVSRRLNPNTGTRADAMEKDGNLVGDLGEACAVEEYGMKLVNTRSTAGFDGHTPDGKQTIQVKAKGRSTNTIAFSYSEVHADHLLVLEMDFDRGTGRAVYNGPERYVREFLPKEPWKGQKQVRLSQLRQAAARVRDDERLPMVRPAAPMTG
jgi:hypothetical protein